VTSPDSGDKRGGEVDRVRRSNGALGAWLVVTALIGLGLWGIYVVLASLDTWNLFDGPSLTAHGGQASSKPWAALVGLVCLLPAAWGALRIRRRLLPILAGFIVLYVVVLQALWRLSPTIWGPERLTYSAADAGETRCWKQVPGLGDLPSDEAVYGMGAMSPTDVWAVGAPEGTLPPSRERAFISAAAGNLPLRSTVHLLGLREEALRAPNHNFPT
jgi:hypothetical protein